MTARGRRRSQRKSSPPPAWPSDQAGPPDPSYSRLGRPGYSECQPRTSQADCKYFLSRISWNIRQLSHSPCITFFLLKYWHSSDFVPRYSTLKFLPGQGRSRYEGQMTVLPCTTFTYVLTTGFSGRKTLDIQGGSGCYLLSRRAECNLDILMDCKTERTWDNSVTIIYIMQT